MKCAANPLFIPCGRAGDTGWAVAVGTERNQVPAWGWGAAPVPGGPQKYRASDTSHGSELPQLSTCKPFFLAFTMRYLPTHLWVPSRFNPNRPGIFWFCLFFMSSAVMKLFLGLSSLFTVFFFTIFFFVFSCKKTNSWSIGVLSAQNWLYFVNVGTIRDALKPTASEKSHCAVQVTQALLSALRKAISEKRKAAGLCQRRNFLIIYVTMMRHRIQAG